MKVETRLKETGKFTTSGKPEKDMLERLLKQASIKLELEEFLDFNPAIIKDQTSNKLKHPNFNTDYTLKDVTKTPSTKIINKYKKGTTTNINYFMETAFNDAHPKYKYYYKISFLEMKVVEKTMQNKLNQSLYLFLKVEKTPMLLTNYYMQ
ncbi:MAG: hypothetical protein JKY08_01770 [Flavobacteriaceae bacterium]|nr:hypothetical protein [Flavobacteriaceae bacterium]